MSMPQKFPSGWPRYHSLNILALESVAPPVDAAFGHPGSSACWALIGCCHWWRHLVPEILTTWGVCRVSMARGHLHNEKAAIKNHKILNCRKQCSILNGGHNLLMPDEATLQWGHFSDLVLHSSGHILGPCQANSIKPIYLNWFFTKYISVNFPWSLNLHQFKKFQSVGSF